jgi:hypothetical protein
MTQKDKEWLEQWLEGIELKISYLSTHVHVCRCQMTALKQTLAALRKNPNLTDDELLNFWNHAADAASSKLVLESSQLEQQLLCQLRQAKRRAQN